jgi:two-component system, NtrC family, response regulator AtoC
LHLLTKIAQDLGRPGLSLGDAAQRVLYERPWPGNVRELKNALERAAILAEGLEIAPADLLASPTADAMPALQLPRPPPRPLRDVEHDAIVEALAATGGHRKQAAELLGIGLRTLYDKIKDYGLGS